MKNILLSIGIIVCIGTGAIIGLTQEKPGKEVEKPVEEERKAIYLKVVIPFKGEQKNDPILVEDWIASELSEAGKGKVAAATDWVRLPDPGEESSEIWNGIFEGGRPACPATAKTEESSDGRYVKVTTSGWAPFPLGIQFLQEALRKKPEDFNDSQDTLSIYYRLGIRKLAMIGEDEAYVAIMIGSPDHEPGVSKTEGRVFDKDARILASLIEDGNWMEAGKMISEGVNVDAPINQWKRSAIHVVAASSARNPEASLRIAEMLLKAGADVNAKTASDLTPLHEAARTGSLKMVEWLVKNGAQVNAQIVIRHCLDPDYKANQSTPLDFAMMRNDERIINFLKEKGAAVGLALFLRC